MSTSELTTLVRLILQESRKDASDAKRISGVSDVPSFGILFAINLLLCIVVRLKSHDLDGSEYRDSRMGRSLTTKVVSFRVGDTSPMF